MMRDEALQEEPSLLLLIGSGAATVPSPGLACVATTDAAVLRFSTASEAARWLAQVYDPSSLIRVSALEIDRETRMATWQSRPISLTGFEFDILAALAAGPDRTRSFRELDSLIWGDSHRTGTQRTRSMVKRLRRTLAASGTGCQVRSVRGVGFQLLVPHHTLGELLAQDCR